MLRKMRTKSALFLILCFIYSTLAWAGMDSLVFSNTVPKKQKEQILNDLEVLKSLDFKSFETDSATQRMLGLLSIDALSLEDWLSERMKFIVTDKAFKFFKVSLNKKIKTEKEDVDYPNPKLPSLINQQSESENSDEGDNSYTVMTNLGAAIYLDGKKERKLYRMNITTGLFRSESITIDSPRVGIIQIGEGLFDRRFNINNSNLSSVSNSLHRLGVFFHEARHSDGHGESLAFVHTLCPKGHDYEGLAACDSIPNGAYGISAGVVKELLKTCTDELCTEREREILRLTILDSENRILNKSYKHLPAESLNPNPEKLQ